MDKVKGKTKTPEPPSPFFLQKNTCNDERQIMTSIEKCGYPQKFHGNFKKDYFKEGYRL